MKRAADADEAGADDRELLQDETSRASPSLAYACCKTKPPQLPQA